MEWLTKLFAAPDIKRIKGSQSSGDSGPSSPESSSSDDNEEHTTEESSSEEQQKQLVINRGSSVKPTTPRAVIGPHITDKFLEDEYFEKCQYERHRHLIALCYDSFAPHSPLRKYGTWAKHFAPEHLLGLEYLMDETMRNTGRERPGEFPCIHLSELSPQLEKADIARPLPAIGDTFIVNRRLDYIYNYIIDLAYLSNRRDARMPQSLGTRRQQYRERRINSYEACRISHTSKEEWSQCPHEWVLYTKRGSAFFTECKALLDRNNTVCYETGELYLNIMPVSYNLVSFLCGPFPGTDENSVAISMVEGAGDSTAVVNTTDSCSTTTSATDIGKKTTTRRQQVMGYEQWVIVPLFFIDLWTAMHPPSLSSHSDGDSH